MMGCFIVRGRPSGRSKSKVSRSKTRMRRAHDGIKTGEMSVDSTTGQSHLDITSPVINTSERVYRNFHKINAEVTDQASDSEEKWLDLPELSMLQVVIMGLQPLYHCMSVA